MTTWQTFAAAIVNDHVLGSRILSGPVRDLALEIQLTALRRRCLMASGGPLPLLAHLAIQGFINEYAWREDAAETAALEPLWARAAAGQADAGQLLLLGCYRPLHRLPNAATLLSDDAPTELKAVLREQVADVLRERELAEEVRAVTPIRRPISQTVRDQYEVNPYPRWTSDGVQSTAPLGEYLRGRYPGVDTALLAARPQVLVAGCGTGRHAIQVARSYAGAEVLAVDLSRASLAYALRKARELGLGNIDYAQADLLELGSLGRSFDIVESVGVLHHLEDPFEGARMLAGLLRPGGMMRLGVYSAAARAVFAPAKALARSFGPGRIRELRAAIIDAPASDPVRAALTVGDFYASSPCRDLLMHVHEHELCIADLQRMLDENGLRFAGFHLPEAVRSAYRAMFPGDPDGLDLARWADFEAAHPATFLRMYQFAAQKPAKASVLGARAGADDEATRAASRAAALEALRGGPVKAASVGAAIRYLRLNWPADGAALAGDEVLAELLVSTPIYPIWLERRLTAVRRALLLGGSGEADGPLLANLAIQGHLNEYAWAIDAEEAARVAALSARLPELTPTEVMLLGCYAPLGRLAGCEVLLRRGWTGPVEKVLDEQVMTLRRETALQARIQTLTPIRSGVSETVQGQYEASPYPRWRRVMPVKPMATIYGWRVPPQPRVLFAGCGTGDHAIHAGQAYAGAKVLAVDLSRASLGYALRKAREAGIGNMAFCQADLLELRSTGLEFDAIECSGVLHHFADPFEGARAVASMLRPGGAMKIGLYSATARAGLKAAKALAARHTPETIRELRQAIMAALDDDPLRDAARFADFYATSSCRDLLMHVQEHEMTMADLRRMMDENGLRFLAFQTDASVKAAYRAMFPDDPGATDLTNWEAFEQANPATFRGMYQFWTVKAG